MKPSNGINGKNGSEQPFLNPLDLATLFYVLLTTIYICAGLPRLRNVMPHMLTRTGLVTVMCVLAFLDKKRPGALVSLLRSLYPLLMLSYFYTETNYLKNIVFAGNFDAQVSLLEEQIFNCQPSLAFCVAVSQKWFNELMNICYFSYYLITPVVCIGLYAYNRLESARGIFIVMFSFYMYYTIYDIVPVVGPQFYFGPEQVYMDRPYLFGKIMNYLIATIEEPTGAFPSSHVGIALILSWVSLKYVRELFWFIFPFAIGICFATVYLKAHYLLDVIGGLVTVPLFIFISNAVYNRLMRKCTPEPDLVGN